MRHRLWSFCQLPRTGFPGPTPKANTSKSSIAVYEIGVHTGNALRGYEDRENARDGAHGSFLVASTPTLYPEEAIDWVEHTPWLKAMATHLARRSTIASSQSPQSLRWWTHRGRSIPSGPLGSHGRRQLYVASFKPFVAARSIVSFWLCLANRMARSHAKRASDGVIQKR